MEKSKYTTNSETDRVFNVFDTFKKDAENTKLLSANDAAIATKSLLYTLGWSSAWKRLG